MLTVPRWMLFDNCRYSESVLYSNLPTRLLVKDIKKVSVKHVYQNILRMI